MGISDFVDERDRQPSYDPLRVEGKKDGHRYRWIRKDKLSMDRRKWEGWEPVSATTEKSILSAESGEQRKGKDVDTTVNIGDLVLASMPEDRFQQRLAKPNEERIKHLTNSVSGSFRQNIRRASGEDLGFEEHRDNPNMKKD